MNGGYQFYFIDLLRSIYYVKSLRLELNSVAGFAIGTIVLDFFSFSLQFFIYGFV